MQLTSKEIQNQYDGFLKTPFLWKENAIFDLEQFRIISKYSKFNLEINQNLRLGKYVERFVSHQLSQEPTIEILAENIQIQHDKRTLGELDCLLKKENKIIHLEIIYKFYLYDETVGSNEIDHFIGPNRKDSLLEKLTKLKEKQLPLLYSTPCKTYLKSINLSSENIRQQVYFKAQLFVPFANRNMQLQTLNQECIIGFYINKEELQQFNNCKFFLPNKKDWLITPHQNVLWENYNNIKQKITKYFEEKYATLIWIKNRNGVITKAFLSWW